MDPVVLDLDRLLSYEDRDAAAQAREWDAELASLAELAPVVDVEASEEYHEVIVEGIMSGEVSPPEDFERAFTALRRAETLRRAA